MLARLLDALRTVPDIVRQPAADPTAALLLLFLAFLLFGMVALGVLYAVQRRAAAFATEQPESVERDVSPPVHHEPFLRRWRESASFKVQIQFAAALTVVIVASTWTVFGVTTQRSDACEGCHTENPHMIGDRPDPHTSVRCVRCHEYGNPIALVSVNTLERFSHMVSGRFQTVTIIGYGRSVSSTSCADCHREQISRVSHDVTLGIRMSHAEPIQAGAECVDCHILRDGVVSKHTIGMDPCLKCHNGDVAPAECGYCHTADVARAIRRAPYAEGELSRRQVLRPECGSCHEDQSDCDSCHGIRMPHTEEFTLFAHARDGVIDIWENGGRACARCHDDGDQTPCSECHQAFLAHGDRFRDQHGRGVSYTRSGCTCHDRMAYRAGRNFCAICHDEQPRGALP